jgi:hypothetical protein
MRWANVWVTDHALDRWRQRVAENGDAMKDDVRRAVRAARRADDDALRFCGLSRNPGTIYLHAKEHGAVFLCRQDGDALVVVSVMDATLAQPVTLPRWAYRGNHLPRKEDADGR